MEERERSASSSVVHLEFDHKFSNVFEQVRLRTSNAQDPLTPFPGELTGLLAIEANGSLESVL